MRLRPVANAHAVKCALVKNMLLCGNKDVWQSCTEEQGAMRLLENNNESRQLCRSLGHYLADVLWAESNTCGFAQALPFLIVRSRKHRQMWRPLQIAAMFCKVHMARSNDRL